ncbi:MAG: rhodanese-like domain-containing protein [Actinomycetes bacterium]
MRVNKKFLGLAALLSIAAVTLTACGSSTSAITNLSSKDFATKISDTSIVVLDVRTAGEFAAGHIARAINIDVDGANFQGEISKLDKSATYAVYCHSGRRSGIATDQMAKLGFTHLYNLTSGLSDWLANGLPVVTA